MEGFDKKSFPDCKRESIYWMIQAMCGHYGVPYFEQWVVGLSRTMRYFVHRDGSGWEWPTNTRAGGQVPVDNPPVDWWLFLFPEGIDWAAMDGDPVYAVIAHVAHLDASYRAMIPICFFTESLRRTDWSQVAQMGRVAACRHLNRITAQCLAETAR